jgi:hypothetical protein
VKLTAAPVLAVTILARRPVLPSILAAALALSLIGANYGSTGCPLFPSTLSCAEQGPAVGVQKARYVELETRDWARYLERLPADTSWAQLGWLPAWFRSPANAAFFLLSMAAAIIILRRRAWDAAATAGLLVFSWIMATVPDARLGYGAAALLTGLAIRSLAGRRTGFSTRLPLGALVCLAVILDSAIHEAGYYWLLGEPRARPTPARLLVPPDIKRPQIVERSVNDVRFVIPIGPGAVCWGAPQPCMIHEPDPRMRLCRPPAGVRGGLCR